MGCNKRRGAGVCDRRGIAGGESGVSRIGAFDISTRLADDLEIADHRILRHFVVKEGDLVHVVGIAADTLDRLQDMSEIGGDPLRPPLITASQRPGRRRENRRATHWG